MTRVAGLMFAAALAAAAPAHASLIDHNGFVHDTTTNLDWLKLPATFGDSYDTTRARLATDLKGWHFATQHDLQTLFTEFNLPLVFTFHSTDVTQISGGLQYLTTLDTAVNLCLGVTPCLAYGWYGAPHPGGGISWAGVEFENWPGPLLLNVQPPLNQSNAFEFVGVPYAGSFLVRSTPEPATIGLVVLGLAGLWRRRARL